MQALYAIPFAVAIWMAWGTWIALRPNSNFFDSDFGDDKREYWAFVGFLLSLVSVIYFLTFWLLNFVFPDFWAERISGGAAFFGSVGLLVRMHNKKRTILQIDFWINKYRSKEITQCLTELAVMKPLFANVGFTLADTVLNRVQEIIISDSGRKALLQKCAEKNSPRDVVLYAIVQVSMSLLASGQFHIYRNTLNMEGNGIKTVFEIALRELVKSGFADEAKAAELRHGVEDASKGLG